MLSLTLLFEVFCAAFFQKSCTSFLKRFFRADLRAFHTEYAFCPVFAPARVVRHIDIHRAYLAALAAGDALCLVAFYSEKGKIAHGLEKYRDGTYIFAECPVVLKGKGKYYSDGVVYGVSNDKCDENYFLDIARPAKKQDRYENK